MTLPTILELRDALDRGETTSLALTEAALARIADADGEGARTFTAVWQDRALAAARASDTLRAVGLARSPIDGLPVSIKDLFDVAGQVTRAGSVVRRDAAPAVRDAEVVRRLAQAGAVLIGHTNMTEFAFSGLGINPHYGTPAGPWDRAHRRIPGGSSSGAGVSVADGMSVFALGTDTGGSIRIPAAFCGLTGFKPTASRVPAKGAFPLSTSLDSSGPLAASVHCCAIVDAILSGTAWRAPSAPPAARLRLAIPGNVVLERADDIVLTTFEAAVARLRAAGAQIETLDIPEFGELAEINRKGGLICAEAYAVHRSAIETQADQYDPRVISRILRGRDIDAADYIQLLARRAQWIAQVEARLRDHDALLMPTTALVAPTIAALEASDEAYFRANALILRNTTLINFLDGCALSLPCHTPGEAPVGLMIAGPAHSDARILDVGLAVEQILAAQA